MCETFLLLAFQILAADVVVTDLHVIQNRWLRVV